MESNMDMYKTLLVVITSILLSLGAVQAQAKKGSYILTEKEVKIVQERIDFLKDKKAKLKKAIRKGKNNKATRQDKYNAKRARHWLPKVKYALGHYKQKLKLFGPKNPKSVPELSAAAAPVSIALVTGLLAFGAERRRRKQK